jgi:FMN phosphatase YigB (HAD superfamily)
MECSALGLDGFFEFFVYSSEVPFRKPHPSIFRLALQRWQFRPEEVLYVGDDLKYDVEGAGRVGMRTAWVNRKGRGRVEGIRPDYEISSLLEILALDNCGERSD